MKNIFLIVWFAFSFNNVNAQKSPTRFANINGLSIAYSKTGTGPAIVLLHGFTQDSSVWNIQIESLSKYFTVIAWDAPGAGLSSDPGENFTISDWADCLAGLLDSIGIKQAHILGLSWGGLLAQEFYRRFPDRVLSLILSDTTVGWTGSFSDSTANALLANCIHDSSLPSREFVNKYLPGMFSDSVPIPIKDELAEIMNDTHPVGFRLMATAVAKANTRSLLPGIVVPTLLIWGEADKRSPLSVANQFHSAIQGSKIEIIPGAGHVSNMEKPALYNKAVINFCLSVSAKK